MSNAPKYYAYSVRERGQGKKSIWTRIGAVWAHEKGGGLNIELEAIPFNFDGKIILMPPKPQASTAATPAAFDADEQAPF